MIIGVRCSVDLMDIARELSAYKDIPVEVALPHRCNDFLTRGITSQHRGKRG